MKKQDRFADDNLKECFSMQLKIYKQIYESIFSHIDEPEIYFIV
jgi:hypothetical protein